jgi:hypothetical protein
LKTIAILFLAGIITVLCGSTGRAQLIYSNNFSLGGSGTLEGTAPTVANTFAGGLSTSKWVMPGYSTNNGAFLANGSINFAQGNSAVLSFTPQSGYVYTLNASITLTAGMANWIGLGFSGGPTPNQNQIPGQSVFSDPNEGGGYDWLILNGKTDNVQYFAGGKAANPMYASSTGGLLNGAGTYSIEIQLDTIGTLWSEDAFINGVEVGSTNFLSTASNPTIKEVGITENNPVTENNPGVGTATFNTIDLSAQPAPEPSVFALTGLGLIALLLFYKKLKPA